MSQGESDVPWDTAEDHVRRMVPRMDLSHDVVMDAYRLAREYDGELSATPSSVASSAVYVSSLINNQKVTQARIAEAGDCGAAAIQRTYREILKGEGYSLTDRDRHQGGKDEGPRWSITVPTGWFQAVKSLVVPMAAAMVVLLWLLNGLPIEAFAAAIEQTETVPVFDSVLLDVVAFVVFIGVVLSFLRPFVGGRLA